MKHRIYFLAVLWPMAKQGGGDDNSSSAVSSDRSLFIVAGGSGVPPAGGDTVIRRQKLDGRTLCGNTSEFPPHHVERVSVMDKIT